MKKLILLYLILISALILANYNLFFYPTDKYLEDNFRINRAEFERLIKMIQEDKRVIQVNKNGEILDIKYEKNRNIIPKERLNEYISLLTKINAISIRLHTDNKIDNSNYTGIDFLVYENRSWLLGIGGTYKYYIFTQTAPEHLVESLDEIKSNGGDASHAKSIAENWYLYLDIW